MSATRASASADVRGRDEDRHASCLAPAREAPAHVQRRPDIRRRSGALARRSARCRCEPRRTASIWSIASGRLQHRLCARPHGPDGRGVQPRRPSLATAAIGGDARIWTSRTAAIDILNAHRPFARVAFSPDDQWLITAGPTYGGLADLDRPAALLSPADTRGSWRTSPLLLTASASSPPPTITPCAPIRARCAAPSMSSPGCPPAARAHFRTLLTCASASGISGANR